MVVHLCLLVSHIYLRDWTGRLRDSSTSPYPASPHRNDGLGGGGARALGYLGVGAGLCVYWGVVGLGDQGGDWNLHVAPHVAQSVGIG